MLYVSHPPISVRALSIMTELTDPCYDVSVESSVITEDNSVTDAQTNVGSAVVHKDGLEGMTSQGTTSCSHHNNDNPGENQTNDATMNYRRAATAQIKDAEEEEEEAHKIIPPDGGWGWMVVFGSFIIMVSGHNYTVCKQTFSIALSRRQKNWRL